MSKRRFILAVVLVALAFSPAVRSEDAVQQRKDNPAAAGPLETMGDVRPVQPEGEPLTSPAYNSASRGFFMSQVNVNGSGQNILGDAGNEPSICVDPTDPNRMCIGWRQFDSVSSDFRQAGYGYTTDGGITWTFPGRIEAGIFRSDPVLASDASGNFYYNSLTTDEFQSDFWCHVFKSTDGGASWDNGTYAYGGDKQWFVIDKTGGTGNGNHYAFWTDYWSTCYPGFFTRSTNGGTSYESCITVSGSPYWGTLDVNSGGQLYICGDGFTIARSSNAQNPGSTISWDVSTTVNLDGSILYSGGPNPGGLMGQAWVATDRSGGPTDGNVYLLCSVDRSSTPDPCDVMFARSTNGGSSWSAPVRVNDDAGTAAYQWFGTMSVAPNGRIDVVWLDTRDDPGGYDSALYYSYSEDGGATWSPNEALTASFDPHVGWPVQNKMGDYFHMISDNTGAHLAFSGTYNGEQDVYYAHITRTLAVSVPGGAPISLTPGMPTAVTVRVNPGTENYIPGTATMYYRYSGSLFLTQSLVPLGGDLYQATLPAADCTDSPEFYFSAEGDQSGVVTDPYNAPAGFYSAVVGETAVFYSEPMDSNPGWTTTGLWAWGQPTGGGGQYGNPDPTSGHTGANVYGYNLSGDYENSLPERHLTSTAIDCTGKTGVTLSFWRYLGVETSSYDHAYLRVSTNGTSWTTLWQNGGEVTDSSWVEEVYDISAFADNQPTVYLRWTMGTTDSSWQFCGWNIDDVSLSAFECNGTVTDTIGTAISANPAAGTLPFVTQFTAQLSNLTDENRRAAGRVNVILGNGTPYTNWRAGFTNLSPAEVFTTFWNQSFPALASLVGNNVFTLQGQDVTPAPYNQPPFAPSGDTDSDSVTITATAP
jgi:hypothetical protein